MTRLLLTVLFLLAQAFPPFPAPIDRGPGELQRVAFTCNVVWGTEWVLPVAEAFARRGDRATFFLGGGWAKAHPDLVRTLKTMGMEIGNHGYGHRHVASLGLADNLEVIDRADVAIRRVTGEQPRLYAPAYGEINPTVLKAAAMRGYRVVMWTIDTVDWRPSHTADVIRRRVLQRLFPGAIVLIHPTERTVKALGPLLDELHRLGYRATTITGLLQGTRTGQKDLLQGERPVGKWYVGDEESGMRVLKRS